MALGTHTCASDMNIFTFGSSSRSEESWEQEEEGESGLYRAVLQQDW